MLGYWTSHDVTAVVRLFVANLEVLDGIERGLALFGQPVVRALHWFNRNTRSGSRRNIAAHYDLGNDLFERMLDRTMMYSAAMFENVEDSLEQAQLNKLERICRKLELGPEDHLLEIGTGWGSMALYAAVHYGCRVTTTTLSREQYAYTQRRIEEQGLQDRITLLLEDYRDLEGQFDKLVSVEMIEQSGTASCRSTSASARACSNPMLMLLQAITIRDQRYERARRSVDFIQRYIFPGGALPSVQKMVDLATRETDMNLVHMEDFGEHYARTLRLWHDNLRQARQELEQLGYDEQFYRLWEFYLCYCEGGFLERAIGTAQLLLAKPAAHPDVLALRASGAHPAQPGRIKHPERHESERPACPFSPGRPHHARRALAAVRLCPGAGSVQWWLGPGAAHWWAHHGQRQRPAGIDSRRASAALHRRGRVHGDVGAAHQPGARPA